MSDHFDQLPMLPIVIPFGIVVFGLLLWRLAVIRLVSPARIAVAAALAVYAAGIVANTVFPIYTNVSPRTEPWYSGVVFVPFADYEIGDAVLNALIFVPLSMLLTMLFARPTWWKVLIAVTVTSVGIELTQLAVQELFGGGHIADASDLVSNVAGGMLGYGLLVLLMRVPSLARLIAHFRWAPFVDTGERVPRRA